MAGVGGMEFNMEWNVICRVCLQEGEMRSLYETDDKNIAICDKIIRCSNITIKRGMNLPEQICDKCLADLNVAYKFRMNCESADAILQSFIDGNVVTDLIISSDSGGTYKYKPPHGLNVKRIKTTAVKIEPNMDSYCDPLDSVLEDNGFSGAEDDDIETTHESAIDDAVEAEEECDDKKNIPMTEEVVEEYEVKEDVNLCTIQPVKSNRGRAKAGAAQKKIKVVPAQTVTTKPDGTTVIRYRRNVEEQKPLKICEICGNTYKYKHALESHMRRHRNEKPFSCEICGRSFVINFELRRHMRTHTGQKPYACRFCGRRFSDFGSRIKHERTHTGERPYPCETCGKSFAYSHVLSSHILTHTGEKRYGCTTCGKRFTKSHHLKAHLNTHMKNSNKPLILRSIDNPPAVDQSIENEVIYEDNSDKVYGEVLAALSGQQKIEEYVDEDGMKVIYSEEEHHTIDSINLNT